MWCNERNKERGGETKNVLIVRVPVRERECVCVRVWMCVQMLYLNMGSIHWCLVTSPSLSISYGSIWRIQWQQALFSTSSSCAIWVAITVRTPETQTPPSARAFCRQVDFFCDQTIVVLLGSIDSMEMHSSTTISVRLNAVELPLALPSLLVFCGFVGGFEDRVPLVNDVRGKIWHWNAILKSNTFIFYLKEGS